LREKSKALFLKDRECPLENYEPSGADFLSPCMQEADLMRLVLDDDYESWIKKFLPDILDETFTLKPGRT